MTATAIAPPHAAGTWRFLPPALGLGLLLFLWAGPLPERAAGSFAAHMVMHMGVVAVAAPLLAIGVAGVWRRGFSPATALAAAFVEFAAIWTWHAPALHDAARADTLLFVLEQASFLAAGLFVWVAALGATRGERRTEARAAGVAGLLVTSMHMTLLGALLLLSPRPLYACAALCMPAASLTPLEDQALGGTIMLAVGGAVYLLGGLLLLASVLRGEPGDASRGQEASP